MSQTLENVKKRINSVEATKKITSTMQLVSSVKVRKLLSTFTNVKQSLETQKIILNNALFTSKSDVTKTFNSIYINENIKVTKKLYIIVMSNLGLCGAYNQQLYKYFETIFHEGDEVILIGRKAESLFSDDKNIKQYKDYLLLLNGIKLTKIDDFNKWIVDKFNTKEYNSVYIVYQRYVNSLISLPTSVKLLPIELKNKDSMNSYEPEFIPSRESFIDSFIPFYLKSLIKTVLIEANLSEQTTRRNMMDNADKSASDLIEDLKLQYNKARQTLITNEITEVVNSANAIRNS